MISTKQHGFFGTVLTGILGIVSLLGLGTCGLAADQIRVLIIDGQNNHDWRKTTPVLKSCLEATGRLKVDVVTTPGNGKPAEDWNGFRPKFADYGAVMSNYNGQSWPEPVQKSLEEYVSGGGGLVIVHAANNAFPE